MTSDQEREYFEQVDRPKMLAWLRSQVPGEEEDLLHDSLIELLSIIRKGGQHEMIKAVQLTVLKRNVIDFIRKRQRLSVSQFHAETKQRLLYQQTATDNSELIEAARWAKEQLDPVDQQLIEAYAEGQVVAATAKKLRISRSTAYRRLKAARSAIKAHLFECVEGMATIHSDDGEFRETDIETSRAATNRVLGRDSTKRSFDR